MECQPPPAAVATYDAFADHSPAIDQADRPFAPATRRFLTPNPATFHNYTCCPWATSRIVIDPETNAKQLCPVTCKRWGCSFCAPRKIRKLAFLTNGAQPNRWIRLGVQPANYRPGENGESPAEMAWRDTSPKVPELFRKLKELVGECEYLRVAELHNGTTRYQELDEPGQALGFPHYHALLRSRFIEQPVLSQIWAHYTALPFPGVDALPAATAGLKAEGRNTRKLESLLKKPKPKLQNLKDAWDNASGAPVVWIAKIDQTFSSFRYLTKYLTKLHRLEWTDRHVSYSRGFFRAEDLEKLAYPERQLVEVSDVHPWKLLTDRYGWQSVAANPDGTFLLPDETDGEGSDVPMSAFGLRIPEKQEPEPTTIQTSLPGLSPREIEGWYDQPF
jgi:hypothetical protein